MVHDITPPLSPTSSVGSTNFPATPIDARAPAFVDESVVEGRFALLKNYSEVWEESKDVGYDSSSVTVADPGILISPSSSLLSGLDLLGGATSTPPPEVIVVPIRSQSHQIPIPHDESFLDFPSPPKVRRTSFGGSRPIGKESLMVRPLSRPGLAVPCDLIDIPQSTHFPQSNPSRRRWSALPPAELHPDNRRRSSECITVKGPDTFCIRAAATHTDTPVMPRVLPKFPTASGPGPAVGLSDESSRPSPKKPDPFTSFIDMSVTESALSTSRVHKLFLKISSGFKPRNKRRF